MAAPVHGLISAPPAAPGRRITRGWYRATGGLELVGHPEWPGAVLWSSFEHHLTADRVIGTVGDFFAPLIEASGIAWAAVTDPDRRRNIVLQLLAQLPVLWIWDNVEPVTGFPAGTPSDWAPAEQDNLASLLRDLAQQTRCKVLLTSRRDEHAWLGDLPARVQLPRDADARKPAAGRRARRPARPRHRRGWDLAAAAAVCGREPADDHGTGRPGAAREPGHFGGDRGVRGPAGGRGGAAGGRGRMRRWAAPGRWPPR